MAKKLIKKAQEGTELRKGQYKRIGRIAEKNPEKAERVAERMNTRASRVDRGKEIANPSKMEKNPMYEMRLDRDYRMNMIKDSMKRDAEAMKKGGVVKKKMKAGGMMKPKNLSAGVSPQNKKKVGPIDPKGAYTKVQERTLGKMKKGGKIKKK